ncbi:hypothetical protein JTE90_014343 [Oedothorax gibbosus]|uniref:DDE Tnp4 domain-containing protein n=1 Tax=Oedothorax gibbosus TaxID=931172 RepID=A0AAV6TTU1_9ARAC|nr:hypothetical protein JTE90_014343 [Oedothorax gibbosus]
MGDDLLEVADSFLGLGGLPGVVGVVDATHIPIKAPSINAKEYYCRKSHHSVLLQGVADHKKRFTNVYFGWPGSVKLSGTDTWIDVYLVGDPAYPLKSWLMKPVPGGGLSAAEQAFNQRLSRNRFHVEHAFGFLKGRWRCLLKANDVLFHNLQYHVMACCILYNICQDVQDEYFYDWLEAVGLENDDPSVAITAENSSVTALLNSAKRSLFVVPKVWILSDNEKNYGTCSWPPVKGKKRIDYLVQAKRQPDAGWMTFRVKILYQSRSYDNANSKLRSWWKSQDEENVLCPTDESNV